MWVEIGDPQPVSVESFPNEHADRGQAVSKGGDLVCMMEMALPKAQEWASRSTKWDGLTVQSRFYDPEEMTKWGWVDSSSKDNLIFLGTTEYFLDGLELEPNNDDEWASSNWDHLNTWTVGSDSGPVSSITYSARHELTRETLAGDSRSRVHELFQQRQNASRTHCTPNVFTKLLRQHEKVTRPRTRPIQAIGSVVSPMVPTRPLVSRFPECGFQTSHPSSKAHLHSKHHHP